jgi:Domain of unknown function (DUF4136)
MNKVTSALALAIVALFSACMSGRRYTVETDYSYHGKFKKYKTFDFVKDISPNAEENAQNRVIQDEIKFRMELMGYKQTDRRPDLLVSYRVFFDNLRFTGYNQPSIEEWARREDEEEEYDPIKYSLREGTLLVLLFDGKQQRTIWQGYASGIFGNQLFAGERYLKRPVRLIFDKYRFLAEGFVYDAKASAKPDDEE